MEYTDGSIKFRVRRFGDGGGGGGSLSVTDISGQAKLTAVGATMITGVSAYKYGRIVSVTIKTNSKIRNITGNTVLITGLPSPITSSVAINPFPDGDKNHLIPLVVRAGNLRCDIGVYYPEMKDGEFSFIYLSSQV